MIPPRSIGDTVGYTFGILSQDADISADNTSALLEDIKDGLGGKVDTTTYSELTSLADALYDGNAGAIILNSGYLTALDSLDDSSTFTPRTPASSMSSAPPSWSPSTNASITSQPFVVSSSSMTHQDIDIQSLTTSIYCGGDPSRPANPADQYPSTPAPQRPRDR